MMKDKISKISSHIFDNMNPVLLREFRQLSRNKIVFAIIFLCLSALLLTSGIYIMVTMLDINRGNASLEHGSTLFSLLSTILILATFTFVPLYTSIRFGMERRKGKQDLMYTSAIPPWQIIFGKTMTAAQLTTLIFSLALPFLSFTYLLRGVDLGNAALSIAMLFVFVILGSQLALLFVAIPMSLIFRILITVLFLMPTIMSYYIIGAIVLVWNGGAKELLGSSFMSHSFIPILTFSVICIILFSAALFTLTTAIISPPSSNRAIGIRSYNSIAMLIFLISGMICLHEQGVAEVVNVLSTILLVLACLILVATSAECDTRSLRVQRNIPQGLFKRFLVFPFFQGRLNGIVWALGAILILAAINLISVLLESTSCSHGFGSHIGDDIIIMQSMFFYTSGYTLLGIFIQRKLLKRWYNTGITPIVTVILLLIITVIPYLFAFFTKSLVDFEDIWSPLSPIDPNYDMQIETHIGAAVVLTILGILLNLKLFRESIRSFKPLQKDVTIPTPPETAIEDNSATSTNEL